MKKCRWIAVFLLFCLFCGVTFQVYAEQTKEDSISHRKTKAKEVGLESYIDDEGYLKDEFYEGKSDKVLSEMDVDGLVRTITEEELQAYVAHLNSGIEMYAVTSYQKVSQVNPDTGRMLYTGLFEVDGTLAYCIERSVITPAKGSPTGEWQEVTNDDLRKVLYYGYNGPKAADYTYVETALAAGEANGDGDNSLGRKILAEMKERETPPANFHVWKVETNDGNTQELAFYTVDLEGYGCVKKISGNVEVTKDNSCYSLQGAIYGVYSDADCKTEKGRITTKEDGSSGTITLPAGTYYVKELVPPKGYILNSEVKTMTIRAAETTTVATSDLPQTITPDKILQKVDGQTGQAVAQGTGTLKDAQFIAKFYAGNYEEGSNPATLGKSPNRQWIFKTDEKGVVCFNDAYLLSGDAFWKDTTGKNVLPLGTITIQEIQSSDGYRINTQIFVKKISSNRDSLQSIKVIEPIIQLELTKYQEKSKKVLEGAVFEHISPNGTKEQATTDGSGKISWKGLQRGKHEIREISPAVGYRENLNVITFEVNEMGQITVTSKADAIYGDVRTAIDAKGNLCVEVEDRIGIKLPETGGQGACATMLYGAICCLLGLQKSEKKSKERKICYKKEE